MSSTLVTNLDLSEPQEVLDTEVKSKESNDSFTLNSEDLEEKNLSEEKQKDKDLELETIVEEKKQSVVEEQQKDNDNDSVIKESLNQEEQYKENSTATNANTNETESISEGNKDQSEWTAVWDDNAQAYYYWNVVTNETTWENPNNNNLMAQTINSEYSNYYYSQYGYYPEAYYYGYDNSALTASSDMAATEVTSTEPPTNPLDSLLDKIDKEVKSKLDGNSSKKQSSISDTQHNDQQDQQQEQDQQEQTSLISSSTDSDHYYDQYQMATNDPDYQSFLAEHGGNDGSTEYKLTARFNAKTGKFQRDPTLNPEKFSAESKAIRQMSYFFDYDQFAETRGSSASNKRLSSDAGDSIRSPKKLNKKDIEMFKQKKKEKKDMKKKSWLLSEND